MKSRPFKDPAVKAVFSAYAPHLRTKLLDLRNLIFRTAAETKGAGEVVEMLKWQQPSYLTVKPKSGSTIRIDAVGEEDAYAIFFHCQTNLVTTFRELYSDRFTFEGNRAIHFGSHERVPIPELKHCIALALTYHLKH